jgi:nitroreductase
MPRLPDHPVEPLFLRRWSARAMSGAPVEREALLALLEAARWSPSSGNGQPWRFVYAFRKTPAFQGIFDCLTPGNQEWCQRAGALVLLGAQMIRPDGRAAPTAPFDCGLACMALLLQGTTAGLVVHPMGGFDRERVRLATRLANGVEPQVVIAVGRPGSVDDLSERNREREHPSAREPVSAWAREGWWGTGA